MHNINLDFLRKQSIMNGLTDEELEQVRKLLTKQEIESNETVIEEGEQSTDLYLIAEGEVSVLKWDEAKLFQLPVGTLVEGDMFGEMSFLDKSPRSSTVDTNKKTVLYRLAREDLDRNLPGMQDILTKIIGNVATINIQRLRAGNKAQVKTLRSSLRTFQVRIDQSTLVILLSIFFGIFNVLKFLPIQNWIALPSPFLEWFSWFILLVPTLITIKKMRYYLNDFGVTSAYLKKVLLEAPFFIVGGTLLVLLAKEVWPKFMPAALYPFVWDPLWIAVYFLYCLAYEFLARGVIVTSLKNLIGEERGRKAVFFSSFFMTLVPLFSYLNLRWETLLITFMANLLLGAIYLRYKNIGGVALIHFVVGLIATYFRH